MTYGAFTWNQAEGRRQAGYHYSGWEIGRKLKAGREHRPKLKYYVVTEFIDEKSSQT